MGAALGLSGGAALKVAIDAMKALALVTDAFGSSGGIAQYNRDLIAALAEFPGANRIVVVPRFGDGSGTALPPGVRQLKAQGNQLSYSLTALRAAATLGPFDFVFCGHLHLAPLAALLASVLGVPLWLQLHGYEAWDGMRRAERWSAERARLITSVSRYTRRRFLSLAGVDPSCVRVLPNTVDGGFSPGAKSDVLLDRFCLRGKRVLLTVSRLDPNERRKGHDRVIKALPAIVAAMPNVVYLIAGHGADRTRLEALAQNLGVANSVVFAGRVAPDELPKLYRLADLFVMPSAQEGFGIVFLEAAASGLRAIGGNADGSIDALADGAIGTVIDPNDSEALVRAVRAGLDGGGPDPSGVTRFRFENFSGHVRDLVNGHLLPGAAGEAP
jgi:phosphatidylinositol alpha-1,6-mannosyltransferase